MNPKGLMLIGGCMVSGAVGCLTSQPWGWLGVGATLISLGLLEYLDGK